MTATYVSALDEIIQAVKLAWEAKSTAICGYIPELKLPGIDSGTIPDASKFWARLSTQGVNSEQSVLSESIVKYGSRRYETNGLVFVQLFAPKRSDSQAKINQLSMLLQERLRQKTENVILRNARIKELPAENGCLRINVIADYQFDEIQ